MKNSEQRMAFFKKVLLSCKTFEQRDCAVNWMMGLVDKGLLSEKVSVELLYNYSRYLRLKAILGEEILSE